MTDVLSYKPDRDASFNMVLLEERLKWRDWINHIPSLKFPSTWKIKIIPPFAGALCRFFVDEGEGHVSVYLDVYDNLGCFGAPYWEIYPDRADNNLRFPINETDELLKEIQSSLDQQNGKNL